MNNDNKNTSSQKIIDLKMAQKILGSDDRNIIEDMLDMLQESLRVEKALLQAAYAHKNILDLQKITHKIKGACHYCGILRLKEACVQFEQALKAQPVAQLVTEAYQQMIDEIEAVEGEIVRLNSRTLKTQ